MSYKTIIVNLATADRIQELTDVAISLAKRYSAHIIGLHVIPPFNIATMAGPFGITPELITDYQKAREAMASEVEKKYRSMIEGETISWEWHRVDSWENWSDQFLIKHARCADLIISAQGDQEGTFSEEARITEHLIMEAGRPVLVIPNEGSFANMGQYPVIAWNASKESSRAVFNALPFLREAKEVKAVWIDPYEPDEALDVAGSEIATTLARQGVKIEAAALSSERQAVGDAILNQVREHGGDLLVMGAYGHSRFREFIFGGATKSILRHMTVPVLLSH